MLLYKFSSSRNFHRSSCGNFWGISPDVHQEFLSRNSSRRVSPDNTTELSPGIPNDVFSWFSLKFSPEISSKFSKKSEWNSHRTISWEVLRTSSQISSRVPLVKVQFRVKLRNSLRSSVKNSCSRSTRDIHRSFTRNLVKNSSSRQHLSHVSGIKSGPVTGNHSGFQEFRQKFTQHFAQEFSQYCFQGFSW